MRRYRPRQQSGPPATQTAVKQPAAAVRNDYNFVLPAALALFQRALAAAASLARHAAFIFLLLFLAGAKPLRPPRLAHRAFCAAAIRARVAADLRPRPRAVLPAGEASLRINASSASRPVICSLMTRARRSCSTVMSANEFIEEPITWERERGQGLLPNVRPCIVATQVVELPSQLFDFKRHNSVDLDSDNIVFLISAGYSLVRKRRTAYCSAAHSGCWPHLFAVRKCLQTSWRTHQELNLKPSDP